MAIGPGNHPLATRSAKRCPILRRASARRIRVGYAMDVFQTLDLGLFAVGTFAAAFVTGLAGFAFGIVRGSGVAAFSGANTGRGLNRRVRPDRPGCLGMEIAPRDQVAAPRAVSDWRRDRRANWRRATPLDSTAQSAYRGRCDPRIVQPLQLDPPEPGFSGPCRGYRRRRGRCRQRRDRWRDRTSRHCCRNLVQPPGLATGRAARCVPALRRRSLRYNRTMARRHWYDQCQYAHLVLHRPAGACSRHLGEAQTVWQA